MNTRDWTLLLPLAPDPDHIFGFNISCCVHCDSGEVQSFMQSMYVWAGVKIYTNDIVRTYLSPDIIDNLDLVIEV